MISRTPMSSAGLSTPSQPALLIRVPGQNRRVALRGAEFTIGRSEECDLVLSDNRISRVHARLVEEDGNYFIVDAGSRHGTFVNGERSPRARLQHNDQIGFGVPEISITFLAHEPRSSSATQLFSELGHRHDSSELQQLRLFLDAARALGGGGILEDTLRRMLSCAIKITAAERAFVYLGDEKSNARMACGVDAAGIELNDDSGVSRSVVDEAMRTAAEFITGDAMQQSGLAGRQSIVAHELRVLVALPLRAIHFTGGAKVHGVLYLDSHIASRNFSSLSHDVLRALAGECAAVLESAKLLEAEEGARQYRQEMAIAASIQRGLITHPKINCDFARATGYSLPCKEVGGDFYDIHATDSTLTAIIADVSGKGVSAALLASLIQGMFYAQLDLGLPLPRAVAVINSYLCSRVAGQKYATLLVAQITRDHTLRLVNCGHVPALIAVDGQSTYLDEGDLPIGLLEDANYHLIEKPFPPGSRLCMLTDGITECENAAGQEFGVEAVKSAVFGADPISTIVTQLQQFCAGREIQDDCTLMFVERLP
ncbi:MAG TPA: SpoIIE family protein phosphatase [Candidatus Angelobacter sp.]|nr:SpoIIE family protein phosphatase [Candidatus Angelobacter sp.]